MCFKWILNIFNRFVIEGKVEGKVKVREGRLDLVWWAEVSLIGPTFWRGLADLYAPFPLLL